MDEALQFKFPLPPSLLSFVLTKAPYTLIELITLAKEFKVSWISSKGLAALNPTL